MPTEVVTPAYLQTVFDQFIALIPVIMPIAIAWVGVVKAVSWLKAMLYSA